VVLGLKRGAEISIWSAPGTGGIAKKIVDVMRAVLNSVLDLPLRDICEINMKSHKKLVDTKTAMAGVEELKRKEEEDWKGEEMKFEVVEKILSFGKALRKLEGDEVKVKEDAAVLLRDGLGLEILWGGQAAEVPGGKKCAIVVDGGAVGVVADMKSAGRGGFGSEFDAVTGSAALIASKLEEVRVREEMKKEVHVMKEMCMVYRAMESYASGARGKEGMLKGLKGLYEGVEMGKGREGDGRVRAGWPLEQPMWWYNFPSDVGDSPGEDAARTIDNICGDGILYKEMLQHLLLNIVNTPLDPFKMTLINVVKQSTGGNLWWVDGGRVWGKDEYGKKVVVEVEEDWEEIKGTEGDGEDETVGYIDKEGLGGVLALVWKLVEDQDGGVEGGRGKGALHHHWRAVGEKSVWDVLLKKGEFEPALRAALAEVIGHEVAKVYPSKSIDVILEGGEEEGWVVWKTGDIFDEMKGVFVGDVGDCIGGGNIVDEDTAICYPIIDGFKKGERR